MTPIEQTSSTILNRLKEIQGVKTCDDWGGEIDDLLKKAHTMPGLFLVYGGAQFGPKEVIDNDQATLFDRWIVVATDKNLRAADAAATGCYRLLDAVRKKLIGFDYGGGWLWPVSENLIYSAGGMMAYACEYTTETETEEDLL